MAALSIAMMSDYYLWELDSNSGSLLRASLPFTLDYLADIYSSEPSFGYSFWLLCGGSVFPLLSFLLSWRLLALLDIRRDEDVHPTSASSSALEMTERNNMPPAQIYY
ncbi:hypothetical protein GBAR_LOCUS8797 [Geodia barretti]|nr:hypothetical protein GBAR_LOCUS8797 [Geodia barretti]